MTWLSAKVSANEDDLWYDAFVKCFKSCFTYDSDQLYAWAKQFPPFWGTCSWPLFSTLDLFSHTHATRYPLPTHRCTACLLWATLCTQACSRLCDRWRQRWLPWRHACLGEGGQLTQTYAGPWPRVRVCECVCATVYCCRCCVCVCVCVLVYVCGQSGGECMALLCFTRV